MKAIPILLTTLLLISCSPKEVSRDVTSMTDSDITFLEEFLQQELNDFTTVNRFYAHTSETDNSVVIELIAPSDSCWLTPEQWFIDEFVAASADPQWVKDLVGPVDSEMIFEDENLSIAIYSSDRWSENVQYIVACKSDR